MGLLNQSSPFDWIIRMRKYELITTDSIRVDGKKLYRIRALIDFNDVKAGDIGGFVESENNLSQNFDGAWIYGNAMVNSNARVYGKAVARDDALVFGNAQVFEDAQIYGCARVCGEALICGNAQVYDNARVSGKALVCGKALIYGNADVSALVQVFGNARVFEDAKIYGDARIGGNSLVSGNAHVYGGHVYGGQVFGTAQVYGKALVADAKVYDDAQVYGNAQVCDNAQVCKEARIYGDAQIRGDALIENKEDWQCFIGVGDYETLTAFRTWNDLIKLAHGDFLGSIEDFKKILRRKYKNNQRIKEYYELLLQAIEIWFVDSQFKKIEDRTKRSNRGKRVQALSQDLFLENKK